MRVDTVIRDPREAIASALNALRGKLEVGENVQLYSESLTTPGTADTEFTINHRLGRIPAIFVANTEDNSTIIYASRKSAWSASQIFLKSSTASATVTIAVF